MSTTPKKPNRLSINDISLEGFLPTLSENYLKEELLKIGGNAFSFNQNYIKHISWFLNKKSIDLKNISSCSEAFYIFNNNLEEIPRCYCGKPVKFQSMGRGYAKTCSKQCNNRSKENNNKRKQTFLKKYGCECPFSSNIIKEKIKKTKSNNNSFGSYYYSMQNDIPQNFIPDISKHELLKILKNLGGSVFYRKPNLMDSLKYYIFKNGIDFKKIYTAAEAFFIFKNNITNIPICECGKRVNFNNFEQRYLKFCGSVCAGQSLNVIRKREETFLHKYGVKNFSHTSKFQTTVVNEMRTKAYNTAIEKFSNIIKPRFNKDMFKGKYKEHIYDWVCLRCNKNFSSSFFSSTTDHPICPNCDPKYSDLELFVKNILDKNGIFFEHKNRKILSSKKELDFYLEKYNLGIEINGLYFHNESMCSNDYHLKKTEDAESQGLQLIHIFTDEIYNTPKIVESRIKNILKLNRYKIFARRCEIRNIDAKITQKFLDKYHIQGSLKSPIRLGMFFKNRLVAVMTFSSLRNSLGHKVKEIGEYEMTRFCTISNFNIIGGASKILKYFEKKYNPKKLISYADRRWSKGNLYKILGFSFSHNTNPNYFYTRDFENRLHRFGFQKHLLSKKLENFDPNKTEHQNMLDHGFVRIYDCGSMKFEKTY